MEYNEIIQKIKLEIESNIKKDGVVILPPIDVNDNLQLMKELNVYFNVIIIDPWYNRGIGGLREDYIEFIVNILDNAKQITDHLYLWGFPDIVARFIERIPEPLQFLAWLTWYCKNTPSRTKGWRPSQQTCLHLSIPNAHMYPQNFLNEVQKEKLKQGKLQFFPGPTSVIEAPLLVGFVGRNEQTGHPTQKSIQVYEKLILMTTKENDIILDPMCGSGTTAAVCLKHKIRCIMSDNSEEYIKMCEKRLNIKRIKINRYLNLLKENTEAIVLN